MTASALPLKNQLCFSLYAATIAVNRVYKPMLDAMGITYPQYLVLTVLSEADGLTIGGIAERLALDSSTITPLVKRLEASGLLSRQRNPADERQVQVRLTDQGHATLAKTPCLGDTLLERSGMSLERSLELNAQVQDLIDALGRSGAA